MGILLLSDSDSYPLCIFVVAMVTSDTYMAMFRELVAMHNDSGPFNRSYSNVPMFKLHQVQKTVKLKKPKKLN